jgi:hypothetical protein
MVISQALKIQKNALHTSEWKVINDTVRETEQCNGSFVRNAVGKIVVTPSNKARGDFDMEVSDTKVFYYTKGNQVHILVYAITRVQDKKTGKYYRDMKKEEEWYHNVPGDWPCCNQH